jgi:hypothetical protein
MKKTFCATMAAALLLVLGSLSQAQEKTSTIPSEDAPTADSQASVSDQAAVGGKAEIVDPVLPVEEPGAANSQATVGASDCVGCGQQLPMFGTPASSSCGSCGNSCSGCGTIQATAYLQPTTSCGCSQILQVAYDQPIRQNPIVSSAPSNWVASPVSVVSGTRSFVNPAISPVPTTVYAPTQCGCSTCGSGYGPATTVGRGFLTGNCNDCVPTRGRIRGRIFRNR